MTIGGTMNLAANENHETPSDASGKTPLIARQDISTTNALVYEFFGQGPEGLLEGTVVRPAGDGPWPVIVVNHGASNQPLDKAMQIGPALAQRGYVTIAPRYSFAGPKHDGGTGPSRREQDVKLCIAAAKFAQALDFCDSERCAVAGISAGGFLILRVLTQRPQPFKAAAVVSAGIGAIPDEESELDRIATPLLVQHSAADEVVPVAYGENLYRFLQQRKPELPAKFLIYEGAPHDLYQWNGARLANDLADWCDPILKSKK
ncbi:prolyl oligopeptidase family serine peptidase [Candidatus Sumerlaeota bacterium]|nr:prolyl oligopeptidase family serine peptidase [Candidatus Sumerlaeota bacterium]